MNFSNQSLLLGAIYEMTSAGLSSVRFVTWRPAVALTWESLWAIAGSSFRRVEKKLMRVEIVSGTKRSRTTKY